jgi:hypothetical protein
MYEELEEFNHPSYAENVGKRTSKMAAFHAIGPIEATAMRMRALGGV